MLSTIREKTQGWIATILLALIGIPFALWGINSYFERGGKLTVAEVDGVTIDANEYRQALEQQRQQLQQMLGRGVDPRMFDNPAFKQQVLNGLIDRTLVRMQAEKAGYRVGNAELSAFIQSIPQFQRNGHFDPQLYEQLVRQAGLRVPDFEQRLRNDTAVQQLGDGFTESAFVTETDLARLVQLQSEKREIDYSLVAPARFMGTASATAQDIEAYYQAHREEFKIPEQVRVQFIRLSVEDIAKAITPTEADLRKAYADNADRYVTPEERRVSHILIEVPANAPVEQQQKALKTAEEVRAQIVHGTDFAQLARKYSADKVSAAKGGDLGFVRRGTMVKEFDAALFSLRPGQVSAPVKTQYGYHVLKLVAVKPEVRRSFAQVEPELRDQVRRRTAEDRFADLSEKFNDLVYEHPDSLNQAAETLGVPLQQSDWFSRSGGSGIAADPKVLEAAFSPEVITQANNSSPIETGNALVALRLLAHKDATTKALGEVRAQVEQAVKQEHAQAAAAKFADELVAAAKSGSDLNAAAAQRGVPVNRNKVLTRAQSGQLDPRLVTAVFKATSPRSGKIEYGKVALGTAGYAVYALKRVEVPPLEQLDPATKTQVRQLLERREGSDYYASYIAGLRQRVPVKVYNDRL
jgi:peptidyl-prolyl cis-trans isomerase D